MKLALFPLSKDKKNYNLVWARWIRPVILATWEIEIGMKFEASPGKKFLRLPSQPIKDVIIYMHK
jgi:hypothetical protein